MTRKPTLTGTVLTTAHAAWREKDKARDGYVMALCASYYEAHGERQKDAIYRVCSGKKIIPSGCAQHYAADMDKLYMDVAYYYATAPRSAKRALWDGLCAVLDTIPREDHDDMISVLEACSAGRCKVCMLYTLLLDYAWHVDLAGYTYVAA